MTATQSKKKFISLSDVILLIVIISIKLSILDWYYIPSGSMQPTLQISDRVVVDKDAYNLRIPVLDTIVKHNQEIERGDVVIFKDEGTKSIFIKRVIGTGGDVIEMHFHKVLINGEEIASKHLTSDNESTTYQETIGDKEYLVTYSKHIDEGMVNAVQNKEIVVSNPDSLEAKFISKHYQQRSGKWLVPEGSVFVMGDNRDNSVDSRFAQVGYVKEDSVKGRAKFVLANMKPLKIGNTEINAIPVGFSDFNKDIYSVDPITLRKVTNLEEEKPSKLISASHDDSRVDPI